MIFSLDPPEPWIGRQLADGESQNASLIGAESFSRQQASGLPHHPGAAAGRCRDIDRTLPRQRGSGFDGDRMSRNMAESNMAGYQYGDDRIISSRASRRASQRYSLPMIAGEKAPDFTLYDHTGRPRTLSGFLTEGPVVLFFFP